MRRAQKQQIKQLAEQMEQAHEQIRRSIEQNNTASAIELLEDCQNAGITLGTSIERTEGEGHPTVFLLERYCELVYRLHEEMSSRETAKAGKVYKQLRQSMIKISNSINNGISVRTEAVFLPYKASMWDSLESVWRAAEKDPDCDAYVIPIPYYDKNPDGSFRKEHYEADQYPSDVPVIKYDEFDFGLHRPDVIFIHNAYDSANFVTSVHPFFYSDNLKKYTDKLIYIPYFVLAEVEPDNTEAVGHIKHFCTVPGVFHADKVVVQSEKMRRIYINVLTEAVGKESRKIWEEKILGSGSPKFDKVTDTGRTDLTVPEEWLKVIEKPDGSRKKIVLYNTGITALLKHNEKMLEKMESVFHLFREKRDEISLLWRPHPLIQATIESMRPKLWEAYKNLRERYIEEGWGIYDDSADLNRAITLSDAYYGDMSSLVQLYQETGKPVMVQSVESMESMA